MYGMGDFLQISNPAGSFIKRAARAYKRACNKGHKITWQQAIKAFKSGRLQADGTLRKSKKKTTKKRAARKSGRRTSRKTTRKSGRKTGRKTGKRRSSKRR